MRKIIFVKTTAIIAILISAINFCYAQQKQGAKFIFSTEILPYLYFPEEGAGDGFQVGLARSLSSGKFKVQLTYGINKYTYQLSREYGASIGGMPQFIKKADDNIFTPADDRVEGVPDPSKYEVLENAGIKHFQPDDGAYTTNYGTVEILKIHQFGENWNLDWGLGAQFGLMNLNERAGAVVSRLYYPLSGNEVVTNVTFRLSAKYLYYGFTGRIAVSRKITDSFSVGAASGLHVLMGKQRIDMIKPYLSAMASFKIN